MCCTMSIWIFLSSPWTEALVLTVLKAQSHQLWSDMIAWQNDSLLGKRGRIYCHLNARRESTAAILRGLSLPKRDITKETVDSGDNHRLVYVCEKERKNWEMHHMAVGWIYRINTTIQVVLQMLSWDQGLKVQSFTAVCTVPCQTSSVQFLFCCSHRISTVLSR